MISVNVSYVCGHRGQIMTTIDSAGPDVCIASGELCPACESEYIHSLGECFHCYNLNLDRECGSCSSYGVRHLRVCQVCSAEGYFESHCGEITGFVPVITRPDVIENEMCLRAEGCSAWEYRYPSDPDGCFCSDDECPVINPNTGIDIEPTIGFDDIPF
jgi:hypothetical protein